MGESLLRQWELLRGVPRYPKKKTTQELRERVEAAGFQTTLRSVQRDLNELSRLFPLMVDEQSRPHGWSWEPHAVFDLPGMDVPTALAFELTGRFVADLWPKGVFRDLAPYQERAQAVLGGVDHQGLRKWEEKVRLLPRGLKLYPPEVDSAAVQEVYRALMEEKRFEAEYAPRGATEPRHYQVSPLGLVARDGILYLVATLWDYPEPIQMAVHRLHGAQVLDQTINIPPDFSLDDYIESGHFRYPRSEQNLEIQVLFEWDAALPLYETPISADQVLTPDGDNIHLTATVQDTRELRWWLLGFGERVQILGPPELQEEFIDTTKKLARLYGQ